MFANGLNGCKCSLVIQMALLSINIWELRSLACLQGVQTMDVNIETQEPRLLHIRWSVRTEAYHSKTRELHSLGHSMPAWTKVIKKCFSPSHIQMEVRAPERKYMIVILWFSNFSIDFYKTLVTIEGWPQPFELHLEFSK